MMKRKHIHFLYTLCVIALQKKSFLILLTEKLTTGVQVATVVIGTSMAQWAVAQEVDLSRSMIDNCDIDGNQQVHGRKSAKDNNIPMDIARKEFKCKMAYNSEKATAEGKKLEAELKQEQAELQAAIAENERATAELLSTISRIAESDDTKKRTEQVQEANKSILKKRK